MCHLFLEMWENYVEVQETTLEEVNKGDPTQSSGPRKPEKHKMEGKKNKAQVTSVESATELFVVFMGEEEYDRVPIFRPHLSCQEQKFFSAKVL